MASNLVDLVERFSAKTEALKRCMELQNIAQSPACLADLKAIDNEVTEIELLLQQLKEINEVEKKQLDKGKALLTVVQQYQEGITHIANNLPSHLPTKPCTRESKQKATLKKPANLSNEDNKPVKRSKPNTSNTDVNFPKLQYITVDDFGKVPKYIKGRISYSQVNNTIDGINEVFKEKYKILSLPKSKMGEHVMKKYKAFKDAETDDTKGLFFVIDDDIKNYSSLKLDKAGRSILTVLRHTGRIKEMRSGGLIRYVLNST